MLAAAAPSLVTAHLLYRRYVIIRYLTQILSSDKRDIMYMFFWYNKNLFCSKVYLKYKSITNSKSNPFLLFSVKIPDAKALHTRSLVHTKVAAKCFPISPEETFTCSRPTKAITKSRNVRFAEIK